MLRRISIALFGGCYEEAFRSTTSIYMKWVQHRRGWWANRVNWVINPDERP